MRRTPQFPFTELRLFLDLLSPLWLLEKSEQGWKAIPLVWGHHHPPLSSSSSWQPVKPWEEKDNCWIKKSHVPQVGGRPRAHVIDTSATCHSTAGTARHTPSLFNIKAQVGTNLSACGDSSNTRNWIELPSTGYQQCCGKRKAANTAHISHTTAQTDFEFASIFDWLNTGRGNGEETRDPAKSCDR